MEWEKINGKLIKRNIDIGDDGNSLKREEEENFRRTKNNERNWEGKKNKINKMKEGKRYEEIKMSREIEKRCLVGK